jgi:hypothetical protein
MRRANFGVALPPALAPSGVSSGPAAFASALKERSGFLALLGTERRVSALAAD